jgi:peptidoglycan/LPS O-acetylase OafA/YrhL
LRIYPALIVAVSLTVLAVGLWFTSLTSSSFFANPQTWIYWARNITLITNVAHLLPGAFAQTPWLFAVNASLWTMPYEMAMYLLLAGVWLAVSALHKEPGRLFGRAIVSISATAMVAHLLLIGVVSSSAVRLVAMFFTGSALFILRNRVTLNGRVFAALFVALLASTLYEPVFSRYYPLAIPYLVFYLAYVPGGLIRRFNRIGDYSYGIYIYAWPVQQMTVALNPGIGPLNMFVRSFLATWLLAIMSWHWIEKPSLARKPA